MTQAESRAEQAATIAHVAEVYRSGRHTPDHPSYRVFLIETLNQWDELIADGWIFERTTTEPYPDSASMFQDMDKKRLLV